MCVIAAKSRGLAFPTRTEIQACMAQNRDGFSIAYNKDGKVVTFRTMNPAEMLSHYLEEVAVLDPATTAMIFHARIATHGTPKISNCHCWTGSGMAFAHNGVLSQVEVDPNGDMTDSETFFRNLFLPAYEALGWDYALKMSRTVAGSGSKLAFLEGDGGMHLVGTYYKVTNANRPGIVYFSNTNHLHLYDPNTDTLKRACEPHDIPGGFTLRQSGRGAVRKAPSKSPLVLTSKASYRMTPPDDLDLFPAHYR